MDRIILIETCFYEKDVQILELGKTLYVDGQVDLVHLRTDEKDSDTRGLFLDIGKKIQNDGGLPYSRVANDHIIDSFRESLVTA